MSSTVCKYTMINNSFSPLIVLIIEYYESCTDPEVRHSDTKERTLLYKKDI